MGFETADPALPGIVCMPASPLLVLEAVAEPSSDSVVDGPTTTTSVRVDRWPLGPVTVRVCLEVAVILGDTVVASVLLLSDVIDAELAVESEDDLLEVGLVLDEDAAVVEREELVTPVDEDVVVELTDVLVLVSTDLEAEEPVDEVPVDEAPVDVASVDVASVDDGPIDDAELSVVVAEVEGAVVLPESVDVWLSVDCCVSVLSVVVVVGWDVVVSTVVVLFDCRFANCTNRVASAAASRWMASTAEMSAGNTPCWYLPLNWLCRAECRSFGGTSSARSRMLLPSWASAETDSSNSSTSELSSIMERDMLSERTSECWRVLAGGQRT